MDWEKFSGLSHFLTLHSKPIARERFSIAPYIDHCADPCQAAETTTRTVGEYLKKIIIPDFGDLQYLMYMDRWRTALDPETMLQAVREFVTGLYVRNTPILSSTIDQINLTTYGPLIKYSNLKWLVDLSIISGDQTGGGQAFFDRSSNDFKFHRPPGIYRHDSHLLLRQKQ